TLNVVRSTAGVQPLVAPSVVKVSYNSNQPPTTQDIPVNSLLGQSQRFRAQAEVLTPAGGRWLTVQQSTFTTPATVTVLVHPSQLPPKGMYVGRVLSRPVSDSTGSAKANATTSGSESGSCVVAITGSENLLIQPDRLSFEADDPGGVFQNGVWASDRKSLVTI